MFPDGEGAQEGRQVLGAKVDGMAKAIEEDEPLDPADVGLFGAGAVVSIADCVPDALEQPRFRPCQSTRRGCLGDPHEARCLRLSARFHRTVRRLRLVRERDGRSRRRKPAECPRVAGQG